MTQCCGITAKDSRNQLKIDLFSIQIWNEKITYGVIIKLPKTAARAFHIVKEEEKELKIVDGLSNDDVQPIVEIGTKWHTIHKTSTYDTVDCKLHMQSQNSTWPVTIAETNNLLKTAQGLENIIKKHHQIPTQQYILYSVQMPTLHLKCDTT